MLGIAERGEQQQRLALVAQILAMLERHVEEAAPLRRHAVVIAALDRALGDGERQRIGRELIGMAAEHVARELVEQDDRRERLVGRAEEMLGDVLALLLPQRRGSAP